MNEYDYDKLLNIKTARQQEGFYKSYHYHRYEPTPYLALDELFKQYPLKSSDRVVDFGCGKGRLNFYINYYFHSTVIGIEMNEAFYQEAMENRSRYLQNVNRMRGEIHFVCCLAEKYPIDPADNIFYFFNPFSIQIFIKVINNLLRSVEQSEREVDLILYYGSEDYMYYLDNQTPFELKEEILLPEYKSNPFEKFLIYRLSN